ncbi:putative bifunctional diguanylate cyclase/phosphodiesterase [Modestobacter roseus]|uniref:PAS domain S-box-containing protein/diguanylate cyclase (GGDEF)-like protein n=1 Tax=Modestobacter roseus TaxID=1181884 RepID=A0A562IY21_9ACTN|nr:EAL domain-containing protein [Modestobacter roseus]MQA32761.1 EAL domain-containing protein [Modestobacter roseus]TWH75753.1 PAS domain S-box-containing protein/diguanylate cyclase (GGDEF)-like protein [Modestobacter roseus]
MADPLADPLAEPTAEPTAAPRLRWRAGGSPALVEPGTGELWAMLAQAQSAAQDAYRHSAGLVRMLDVIGRGGSPEELAARAVEALSETFSADLVLWGRTGPDGMDVVAACGFGDQHAVVLPELPGAADLFTSRSPGTWSAPDGDVPPVVAGVAVEQAVHVPVATGDPAGPALLLLYSGRADLGSADLLMLRAVAQRLRSSLEDAARRRTVERLAATGSRLARHLTRQPLLEEAARILATISGARWTSAVTVEDGIATMTAQADWVVDDPALWPRPVSQLQAWPAACRGEPHVIHDMATGPDVLPEHLRGEGRALLCIPVLVDGEPVALLYAVDPRPGAFTSAPVDAACLLAGYVGAALVNARLYSALAESESRLRVLTDAISDLVAVVERAGTVRWASPSYARGLGAGPSELVGTDWLDRVHPDDRAAVREALAACPEVSGVEHRLRRGDDAWAWVETRLAVAPGDATSTVLSSRFVGERRRLEDELRAQATHDPLTGLANRALVRQELADRLAGPRTGPVGVLFCDLDEFKAVNDRLGHEAGDDLLCQVADRLRECLRPGDLLARLGGDEFVVVLDDAADRTVLATVGERMLSALRRPFSLDDELVRIGASVGGALGDRSGAAAVSDLLRDADAAMYEAKRAGRGRVQVFDAAAAQRSVQRLSLRQEVQGALARDELRVVFQPMVALANGRLEGVEALLRWRHPGFGDISPEVFVPLAEETGAIGPIGDWVVEETCRELARWRDVPDADQMRASVNLSAVQLEDPSFVDRVLATVQRYGLPAGALRLEVTESLEKTAGQLTELHRLRAAGVGLVLDDFGVSYSNLAHLRDLPVDTLKIDRSFVAGLGAGDDDARLSTGIVRAVLALSEAAGLAVIAEGVETERQRDALLRLGCRTAQGWLFSPGVDAGSITALLVDGGVLATTG